MFATIKDGGLVETATFSAKAALFLYSFYVLAEKTNMLSPRGTEGLPAWQLLHQFVHQPIRNFAEQWGTLHKRKWLV